MIVSTEAVVFGFPASFSKELHQLGYYALFVHQVSYITTRPLQCEVQQRNFFKNLPGQQRNFLQYGAFEAGSTKETLVDVGFVWGFVLASFGDLLSTGLSVGTDTSKSPLASSCLGSALVNTAGISMDGVVDVS